MNPNELLSEYMQEVEALAQRAQEAKKQLKQLSGTLTSNDGAVTLTVNAAGALQSLSFGRAAEDMPKERLATLILSTARAAQIQAAQQVTSILAPIVGETARLPGYHALIATTGFTLGPLMARLLAEQLAAPYPEALPAEFSADRAATKD